MKIKVSRTNDAIEVLTVFHNADLVKYATPNQVGISVESLMHPCNYYLKAEIDSEVVGILRLMPYTNITAEGEINVLPQYWGTEVVDQVANKFLTYLRENKFTIFDLRKIVTKVPDRCTQVCGFLKRNGFKQEGRQKDCVLWQGEICDVVLYGLIL